ncbi:MAG: LCP family protein [Dorea sp.]|nr:LCP family protein [Dorea sp.]
MSKKKKYRIIIVIEVIILAAMLVFAYGVWQYKKLGGEVFDPSDLEVYCDTGNYTNIALFGLDSRNGELEDGVRSDCMMIASINNQTHDVKIVSVYRDTLLLQKDGTYEKANAAYSFGGAAEAIALLNRNFDLDIVKYVSVNFNALSDVIDALGGIDIEMTEEEVELTNSYIDHTAKVVGGKKTKLKGSGVVHCNGVQAVSYTRVRYTEGYDFKRTHRQRIVLDKVIEAAKKADFLTLNKIVNKVFPQVSTNLTITNILALAAHAMDYNVEKMSGYPFEVEICENVMNHEGSYVIPIGLSDNVIALHKYLFEREDYEPSEVVWGINNDIIYMTGISPENHGDALDVSYSTDDSNKVERNHTQAPVVQEEVTETYENPADYVAPEEYVDPGTYEEPAPYVEPVPYVEAGTDEAPGTYEEQQQW